MNNRKYRRYTKEFKLEAISLAEHSEKSMGQPVLAVRPGPVLAVRPGPVLAVRPGIERELGITTGLLAKWRTRYQIKDESERQLAPSDSTADQREIRLLAT
jgi:transposase-like protein